MQETGDISIPKYFICEVEEKWFGRYKITPHILGAGPKWNSKTTLLPPIRENNLSDTIWPFDGFLALGLDKFTAWLYTAKSFSWAQPHKKGHWIFGLKCIPLPFLVLNNFHLCTKGRIPFNTLTKITLHAVSLELAVSTFSYHSQI